MSSGYEVNFFPRLTSHLAKTMSFTCKNACARRQHLEIGLPKTVRINLCLLCSLSFIFLWLYTVCLAHHFRSPLTKDYVATSHSSHFFLKAIFILSLFKGLLLLCVSVYHICTSVHGGQERMVFLYDCSYRGFVSWLVDSGNQICPLEEQQVLLSTEPQVQS